MDFMNLLLNYRDSRPTPQLCHSSTTFYYRGITYEQTLYQSNPHGMILGSAEGEALCRGVGPRIRGMQ